MHRESGVFIFVSAHKLLSVQSGITFITDLVSCLIKNTPSPKLC